MEDQLRLAQERGRIQWEARRALNATHMQVPHVVRVQAPALCAVRGVRGVRGVPVATPMRGGFQMQPPVRMRAVPAASQATHSRPELSPQCFVQSQNLLREANGLNARHNMRVQQGQPRRIETSQSSDDVAIARLLQEDLQHEQQRRSPSSAQARAVRSVQLHAELHGRFEGHHQRYVQQFQDLQRQSQQLLRRVQTVSADAAARLFTIPRAAPRIDSAGGEDSQAGAAEEEDESDHTMLSERTRSPSPIRVNETGDLLHLHEGLAPPPRAEPTRRPDSPHPDASYMNDLNGWGDDVLSPPSIFRPSTRGTFAQGWRTEAAQEPEEACWDAGATHECTICFEPMQPRTAKTLHCMHVFHQRCIDKWLRVDPAARCPICRTPGCLSLPQAHQM